MKTHDTAGGVLVVDDNPANLRLMSELLTAEGYVVRAAPSGRLALESVQARLPDIVLLDIKMPDMDGFEVCRRLKASPTTRDIPVIFLSALRNNEDKLAGFAVGGVDYIVKPFVAEEVMARVRTHLALRELQVRLEHQVEERTRALRTLSAGNQALVHASSEEDLLENMCRAIVEVGGYMAAWVDLDGSGQHAIGADGTDKLGECIAMAVGSGAPDGPFVIARPGTAPDQPWCACGACTALVLPLGGTGKIVIFGSLSDTFVSESEVGLLTELAGDLSFGVQTLRAREEHTRNREALERSLEQTIAAIAATIEVRDPYTAGHQRRVTGVAAAIGRKLGLSEDRLKGLFVAGTIHDIGKVSIPAETLSRPGRLSEAEFNLIKTHSQTGFDILKGIDFPWPVAQIVRQHHERLDGTGYPDGLAGDAILLESRILAVADVVEAISSHRPYRPALGLEVALNELRQGRDSRYDPAVVDACLELARSGELPELAA